MMKGKIRKKPSHSRESGTKARIFIKIRAFFIDILTCSVYNKSRSSVRL